MTNAINIISFDVPFPANYGGVIDVYYKLYWLKRAGVKIYLHCFSYGRKPAKELEELCEQVYYYPRKTGLFSNLSLLPYTVKSRQSFQLEENLLTNNFPILFEVLHTCYLLNDDRFKSRKKIYRHSNIEHEYYLELSKSEKNFFKSVYLKIEAWKLKRYEAILKFSDLILAVNQKDTTYFQYKFPSVKTVYLPSFHPNEAVNISEGKGEYILFHGNLSVSENYEAAVWLIECVFSKITFPCVIAGLKPPAFLVELIKIFSHIKLVASPSNEELNQLIQEAHIHALYTSQPTGLKLKLLNVLYNGRFIICNENMISGTGLVANGSLVIAKSQDDYSQQIAFLLKSEFSTNLITERTNMIVNFDNRLNATKLISEIF